MKILVMGIITGFSVFFAGCDSSRRLLVNDSRISMIETPCGNLQVGGVYFGERQYTVKFQNLDAKPVTVNIKGIRFISEGKEVPFNLRLDTHIVSESFVVLGELDAFFCRFDLRKPVVYLYSDSLLVADGEYCGIDSVKIEPQP